MKNLRALIGLMIAIIALNARAMDSQGLAQVQGEAQPELQPQLQSQGLTAPKVWNTDHIIKKLDELKPTINNWLEQAKKEQEELRLKREQRPDYSGQPLSAFFPLCSLYEEHEGKKVYVGDEILMNYPLQGTMRALSPYTQRDQFGRTIMSKDSHAFYISPGEVRNIAQACRLKLEKSGLSHRKIISIAVIDKQGANFHVYSNMNGKEIKASSSDGFLTIVPEIQQ